MSYAYSSHLPQRSDSSVMQRFAGSHEAAMLDSAKVTRRMDRREPQRKRMASLTVTVEEADIFRVRRALSYRGPHSVEFVKITRIPRDKRVRLQIGLEAEAVSEVMSKVMGSVNAAEFGRIAIA